MLLSYFWFIKQHVHLTEIKLCIYINTYASKYLIRYLVVCAVFAATALTGIGSIYTCFAGIMGIKLGAYLQPLVRRYIFKRIDPPGEPMPDEPDNNL